VPEIKEKLIPYAESNLARKAKMEELKSKLKEEKKKVKEEKLLENEKLVEQKREQFASQQFVTMPTINTGYLGEKEEALPEEGSMRY